MVSILVAKSTIFVSYELQISIFGLMATFFVITGIILGIISYVKKEPDNFEKKFGLFGNLSILIFGIISTLFFDV